MSAAASLVLAATIWGSLVVAGFSQMCDSGSTPAMVADCYRGVRWALVRGGISVVLAICAFIVAGKARTAEAVLLVGIALLFVAILFSPVFDMLGG